jgi:hypothetical protein
LNDGHDYANCQLYLDAYYICVAGLDASEMECSNTVPSFEAFSIDGCGTEAIDCHLCSKSAGEPCYSDSAYDQFCTDLGKPPYGVACLSDAAIPTGCEELDVTLGSWCCPEPY